jgi:hypothetical protein
VIQNRPGVVHTTGDRPGVRVEEQLCRIEASAGGGIPWSVDAEPIPLLGADAVHKDGPNPFLIPGHVVIGLVAVFIDKGQLHPRRTRRPEPESRATVTHVCAKDRGVSRHWQGSGCHRTSLRIGWIVLETGSE